MRCTSLLHSHMTAPLCPRPCPSPDIIKCLALGASAVLVGRPLLWALTLGGQRGVEVGEQVSCGVNRFLWVAQG